MQTNDQYLWELLVWDNTTWNDLTGCKEMSSG